jgi:hypothetical protein
LTTSLPDLVGLRRGAGTLFRREHGTLFRRGQGAAGRNQPIRRNMGGRRADLRVEIEDRVHPPHPKWLQDEADSTYLMPHLMYQTSVPSPRARH